VPIHPRVLVVPVLLIAAFSLSGCGGGFIGGGAEALVEDALESQTGGQVDLDVSGAGGADIPADWPSKVPLPPGEAIASATLGPAMSISYRISDLATAEAHVAAITGAGFSEKATQKFEDIQLWIFTDGELQVTYQFGLSDSDDGSVAAMIAVIEEQE
jgi:hypothetical protein